MFYLGIDISLKFHRCALLDNNGEKAGNSFSIDSDKKGYQKLLDILKQRGVSKDDLTIGMEATGHHWENLLTFLEDNGFNSKLLNPFQTNRYRQLLAKKAKTDDIEAFCIAGLLRSGEGIACYVPDDQIQGLRDLVRTRNSFLKNLQDYQRQATSLIQLVFPELLGIVKDPFGKATTAILQKFPTAKHFASVHPRSIEKIARSFQGNNFDRSKAAKIVDAAKNSIYSGKAHIARGHVLSSLLSQISQLQNAIANMDETIKDTLNNSTGSPSEVDLITSIPGVGPKTAATLIAEIGDIFRFSSATQLVGYLGLYPQIRESGGKSLGHPRISRKGPKHARRALYMAAVASLKHNPLLRELYLRKLSQGKHAKQAIICVARKLLAIIYSLLRYQTTYNPVRLNLAYQGGSL